MIDPFLMDWATFFAQIILLNFCHAYGVVENRLFVEHGEAVVAKHFRLYHVWLGLLVVSNAFLMFALSANVFLSLFALVYFPFGLDWVWWVIRYYDIVYRHHNDYDGGTGKPWHSRDDWDNYGKFPLLFRVYVWWYVFAVLSACLLVLSTLKII